MPCPAGRRRARADQVRQLVERADLGAGPHRAAVATRSSAAARGRSTRSRPRRPASRPRARRRRASGRPTSRAGVSSAAERVRRGAHRTAPSPGSSPKRAACHVAGVSALTPNRPRVTGWRGRCSDGLEDLGDELVEVRTIGANIRRQRAPSRPRLATVASMSRATRPARPSSSGCARSISGQSHSRPCRSSPSEVRYGEATAGRVEGRAVVVQDAGHGQLVVAAGAAAGAFVRLEHRDLEPGLGEPDRGGEPVGPAADDDRGRHAGCSAPGRTYPGAVQVAVSGTGPLGSHGCSATQSRTLQVPRSTTPRAASITR